MARWSTFYLIRIEFLGFRYHGWQVQENAHTVQAEVQGALSSILKEKTEVTGCGRTDTGVHAKEFYALTPLSHSAYNAP